MTIDLPTKDMSYSNRIGRAYNLLRGTLTQVDISGAEPEVTVEIAPGVEITSVVSRTLAKQLYQQIGQETTAVVESIDVMLAVD